MKDTPPTRVRFGAFELDLRAGELLRLAGEGGDAEGGSRALLPEQPFRLLRMLVEREGNVATREEIQKEFWPPDTIVDFDHSIDVALRNLRRALGDSRDTPKYIETIPKRGYRLMVPVEWIESARDDGAEAPTPSEPGSWVGKKVSHYRLLEIIGGVGMGVVYKAEDLLSGSKVALKFLPEEVASDPTALESFRYEARAASSLKHPNICSIYDCPEHAERPFIVMELLEGQTLRGCLASGSLRGTGPATQVSLDRLLDIALQILDGLQAAHEKGVIHRDIKPVNIFVTDRGVVKILNFGMAQLVESGKEDAIPEEHAQAAAAVRSGIAPSVFNVSRFGVNASTAAYMSPEQVGREKLDARTDLFSFGLVLYEMATGRRAFSGDTVDELREAILRHLPTPVREVRPDLPRGLEQIITKALEKDREERYQNAAEVRAELMQLKRRLGSGSGEQQEVDRGTPFVETHAAQRHTRVLEAAAPKEAIVGVDIEVVAMVRREESGGLRAHLKIEGPLGLTPEDVHERPFEIEFAVDANGTTQPAAVTLRLESPKFEPRTQTKQLRVPVRADSVACTFLITPQVAGELIANLELLNPEEQVVVSRSIHVRAVAQGPAISSPVVVVTIPLVVVVHDAGASIEKFPTGAGEEGSISKEEEKMTTVAVASDTAEAAMNVPVGELPAHPGFLSGKKFSRYRLLEVIGKGGMGMVYEAEDLVLDRRVALKFLLAVSRQHFELIRTVLLTLSLLNHPHIYTVYEFGEQQGLMFLAMELLEGGTLRDRLTAAVNGSRPIPLLELLDIAIQVADGLQAAHDKGIIHGGIRPESIFITEQGVAKILDFGMPHSWVETGAAVLDTRWYTSPEEFFGEELDARTDLFSFGLVLYEMATSRPAFRRDSMISEMVGIKNQTPVPSVRDLNPDIPRELERIIAKSVQNPRELRYQSAAEMRAELLGLFPG